MTFVISTSGHGDTMAIEQEGSSHISLHKSNEYTTTSIGGDIEINENKIQIPAESCTSNKKRYSRHQWIILIVCCSANLCAGLSYSLQAPFYPLEATKKGVPPRIYGLVFGCFDFVNFLACPFFGRNIRTIGPKFMQNAGAFTMGGSCILFGFLDAISNSITFVALSFAIRIVEALGLASFLTATYAIVSQTFSKNVASIFSIVETIFGIGMIGGPAIGGLLFSLKGYTFPFAVIGSALLVASAVSYFALPEIEEPQPSPVTLLTLLKIPSISINFFANVSYAFSLGFLNALLQSHVAQFKLEATTYGLIFTLDGAAYALTAALWGVLADKFIPPKILCSTGALLLAISFMLLGPVPFLPLKPTLWLTILALVIHGIGTGGIFVVAFVDSIQEAISNDFPNTIQTYGLISGLWTSSLALGNFMGPSISGVLNDSFGFAVAASVVFALQMTVTILMISYYVYRNYNLCNKKNRSRTSDSNENHETTYLLHF